MNSLEQLETSYDRWLWLLLTGLVLGVGGQAFSELQRILQLELSKPADLAITAVSGIGWLTVIVILMSLSRRNDSEMLLSPVEDERVRENRLLAYRFGFMAVLITQLVCMVGAGFLIKFTDFVPTVALSANLTIGIGLIAAVFRYQTLNR